MLRCKELDLPFRSFGAIIFLLVLGVNSIALGQLPPILIDDFSGSVIQNCPALSSSDVNVWRTRTDNRSVLGGVRGIACKITVPTGEQYATSVDLNNNGYGGISNSGSSRGVGRFYYTGQHSLLNADGMPTNTSGFATPLNLSNYLNIYLKVLSDLPFNAYTTISILLGDTNDRITEYRLDMINPVGGPPATATGQVVIPLSIGDSSAKESSANIFVGGSTHSVARRNDPFGSTANGADLSSIKWVAIGFNDGKPDSSGNRTPNAAVDSVLSNICFVGSSYSLIDPCTTLLPMIGGAED